MAEKAQLEKLFASLTSDLNDQLASGLDKRDADLCERLTKQIQEAAEGLRQEWQEKQDKRKGAVPGLTAEDQEIKDFTLAELIQDIAKFKANNSYNSHCLDLSRAAYDSVGKDMATTTDSGGGFLVPTQYMESELIPLLQPMVTAFGQGGVRQLMGLSGSPVEVPRVASGSTAYWISPETATVTKSDLSFGQIEMTPKTLASRSRYSNRLSNLSRPAAEALVREQISRDLALAWDNAIYEGSGVSGQPRGILEQSGINSVSSINPDASAGTYDSFIAVEHKLYEDNAMLGMPRWTFHPNDWLSIRKIKDAANQPLERRIFTGETLPSREFLGYPIVVTTNISQGSGLFGVMDQCYAGQWGSMTVDVVSTSLEGTFMRQILVGMEVDVALRHPEAFVSVPLT